MPKNLCDITSQHWTQTLTTYSGDKATGNLHSCYVFSPKDFNRNSLKSCHPSLHCIDCCCTFYGNQIQRKQLNIWFYFRTLGYSAQHLVQLSHKGYNQIKMQMMFIIMTRKKYNYVVNLRSNSFLQSMSLTHMILVRISFWSTMTQK